MSNDFGIQSINKLWALIIGSLSSALIFTAVYMILNNLEKISPNSAASEVVASGRTTVGILQSVEEVAPYIAILSIVLAAVAGLIYLITNYGPSEQEAI